VVSSTPRPQFTPGKDPVPILQEAGWAPGPAWTGAENLASTGIRSPDRPARSQSLYRLSYLAHIFQGIKVKIRGSTFLRNVSKFLRNYAVAHPSPYCSLCLFQCLPTKGFAEHREMLEEIFSRFKITPKNSK